MKRIPLLPPPRTGEALATHKKGWRPYHRLLHPWRPPASSLANASPLLILLLVVAGCGKQTTSTEEMAGHQHDMALPMASDSKAEAILPAGSQQLYTCGMHPHVLSEEEGTCPICGMNLTPIQQTASEEGIVSIDPVTVQNIGVRTALVTVEPLARTVRTTGQFEMDEQGAYTVSLKVSGWVEKLYVDYEGVIVKEGEPLLELYSPELIATQEEYLLALRNARRHQEGPAVADAQRLLDAARRRLAYWDLTEEQVRNLEENGTPQRTLTFFAPTSGEVMRKNVVAGQQVNAGQALMDIVDISKIWLIADIYEQDLGWIDEGTTAEVELPYQPGQSWSGQVDHIYYMLNRETRSARARIVLQSGRQSPFKPGMYATVYLQGEETNAMPTVPEEAVIRTGEQDVVLLALGGGRFQPLEVQAGIEAAGKVQILQGLEGNELVVTSAQFLIDSESRLKSAVGAMLGGHDHGTMTDEPVPAPAPATHDHGAM